jgi:hypothetical protein
VTGEVMDHQEMVHIQARLTMHQFQKPRTRLLPPIRDVVTEWS